MEIKQTKMNKPPRILLYSEHGIGKTTFAAGCPAPIFIQTEDGADALEVQTFTWEGRARAISYKEVVDALEWLCSNQHEFKTVVIDSLDWLEKLIFEKVCYDAGANSIGDIPFGGGYIKAEKLWLEILNRTNKLQNDKKMLVVLLAHSKVQKFDDPTSESYDRYFIDLQNRGASLCCEYVDIVGFGALKVIAKKKDSGSVKAVTNNERVLHLTPSPAFNAKNRYGLPSEIPLSWQALAKELKDAKKQPGNLAKVVEDKLSKDLDKLTA